MSDRREREDGTEVVTCDMCGEDVEESFESRDKRTHVCVTCLRKMYGAWYDEQTRGGGGGRMSEVPVLDCNTSNLEGSESDFWIGEPEETSMDEGDAMTGIDRDFMRELAYGSAVGDALGVPFEFMERDTFECNGMVGHGTFDQPAGTWSDDTSMTIATCESILCLDAIDADDILSNFRRWMFDGAFTPFGYAFDKGNTTQQAVRSGRGLTDEWSKGNGSLMRIAPLAATDCTDDEVRAVSAITHATETCMDLCVSFVHLLRDVHEAPERAKSIVDVYLPISGKERAEIASGGFVEHTYEAALWCFATTDSYEECVLKAVNLGKDTDTTACVAGALAVAAYGLASIPTEWIGGLQAVEKIEKALYRNDTESTEDFQALMTSREES